MLGGDGDSNHDWCHDVRTNVLLPLHLIPPGLCPGEKSQKLGFQFSRFTIQSRNSIRGLAAGTISLLCVGRKNAGRLGTRMWGLIWVRSCAGLAQHCWSAVDVSITSLLLIWFISTANLTISTRKREAPRIICHQSLSLHRNPWTLQNLSIIVMGKAGVFVQNLANVAAFKTTGTWQSHHHHDSMTHPEIFQTTPNNYPAPAVGGCVATATTSYLGRRDNLWCELFVIVCIACYFKMIYHKKKCPQPNNFEFIITKWPCCVLIIPG